jgi:peptide/nickel transport system permease protein
MLLRAILRRLLLSGLTMLLLSCFVFLATEILPGDALDMTLTADEMSAMPPEALERKRQELGLDRPAVERLGAFLHDMARFDFGSTVITGAPVSDIVWYPFRNSLALAGATLAAALPLAFVLGIAAAVWRGRAADGAVSGAAIVGYSIPEFVIGTVLVMLFSVAWPVFPATITANTRAPVAELIVAAPLAIATVVIGSVAYLTRILRAGMIEALVSDAVERLRLAGMPQARIVFVHALPVAILPALTAAALYAAALVSGIVVVELLFAYPGIGQEMVRAVTMRETPVIQAIAILAAVVVVTANLAADLSMLALDPRRRG